MHFGCHYRERFSFETAFTGTDEDLSWVRTGRNAKCHAEILASVLPIKGEAAETGQTYDVSFLGTVPGASRYLDSTCTKTLLASACPSLSLSLSLSLSVDG